mmetsp:Transcript_19396/g.44122  ORF Transcript_19396/g.44122 Transcript_19396/m.44122 type:complete len:314 (+) Transcript_19396:176-1117(+)
MVPVCDLAMPSKAVRAAPRKRVNARNTARFSSATSARSSWSTIWLLSEIERSVSSCAVSSRPKGSSSPYGIWVSTSMPRCIGRSAFETGASTPASPASSSSWAVGAAGASCGSSDKAFAGADSCCSCNSPCSSSPASVAPVAGSFATRKSCRGPFASLESGSAACSCAASATHSGASKVRWNVPSFLRFALMTFTTDASESVACDTAEEKRCAKSGGNGPFTSRPFRAMTDTFFPSLFPVVAASLRSSWFSKSFILPMIFCSAWAMFAASAAGGAAAGAPTIPFMCATFAKATCVDAVPFVAAVALVAARRPA